MYKFLSIAVLLTLLLAVNIDVAEACPMCQTAVESDAENNAPKAYMYSIIFMLIGPAALFIGFSYGVYKLSKVENAALEAAEHFAQVAAPEGSS